MLRGHLMRTLRPHRVLAACKFSTGSCGGDPRLAPFKLYVIAGEASGDAIGAKTIHALQRLQSPRSFEFRGIGGPQMCAAGGFESLFPMQELSVMGLVEVLPYLWRFRRRIQDTLQEIEKYQPDLVLTIDSKGFTFRVLKALQESEASRGDGIRIKKAHYVAPSVWAYKHRGKRDFTELKRLLDVMFTLLPFEQDIFLATDTVETNELKGANSKRSWCQFVGHPAVEDFLENYGLYDKSEPHAAQGRVSSSEAIRFEGLKVGADAQLDCSKFDKADVLARGQMLQRLAARGREPSARMRVREKFGIPADALVICALVGSRANEVSKTSQLVLEAINQFQRSGKMDQKKQICVVFPTIASVESQVKANVSAYPTYSDYRVFADFNPVTRQELFQSSDLAVAVSGTIVLETTLATLPTVVIYRANILTELIAKRLAAVRFVSVPNLLLGRSLLPELLFSDCTAPKIAEALEVLQRYPTEQNNTLELAMAVSTLTKWQEFDASPSSHSSQKSNAKSGVLQPVRASDLAAKCILQVLSEK